MNASTDDRSISSGIGTLSHDRNRSDFKLEQVCHPFPKLTKTSER